MEAYSGLAILATNMKTSLDPAFMRRLRFIVNFPFPTSADRKLMWLRAFPPETPVERTDLSVAVDFDRLACLSLTGGNIHSIALNAAFLAAQSKSKVTMPVVLAAARAEFRKLEKPINEAEFRV
jgi:SpoVK/Ycf46/Vps4 family AAA+-type ATPase